MTTPAPAPADWHIVHPTHPPSHFHAGQRVTIAHGFYAGCTGTTTHRAEASGRWVVRLDTVLGCGRQGLAVCEDGEMSEA